MRIQAMILPAPADQYPFILIVDELGEIAPEHAEQLGRDFDAKARSVGAQGGFVFIEPVEVV